MVDLARELIGKDVEADAVVETFHCLPDAVQIFYPLHHWKRVVEGPGLGQIRSDPI